jgi:hypothetical protein
MELQYKIRELQKLKAEAASNDRFMEANEFKDQVAELEQELAYVMDLNDNDDRFAYSDDGFERRSNNGTQVITAIDTPSLHRSNSVHSVDFMDRDRKTIQYSIDFHSECPFYNEGTEFHSYEAYRTTHGKSQISDLKYYS